MNQNPTDPTNPDAPWEEAMSRDFDARVRDLHEAPLDFTSVKGKARTIRRNRRAAVAGGILGVAAIVTPIAVLTNGGADSAKEPDFAPSGGSETVADPTAGIDYVEGRTWHQADGDEVQIPKGDHYQAAVWDDHLVTIQPWGEAFSKLVILNQDGEIVDSIEDVAPAFAVSNDATILAYTTSDGDVIARWGNTPADQAVLATDVVDTGGGESVGGAPASVTGTAPCEPESGRCLVRIDTYDSGCRGIGSSDVPLPTDALACHDEQDGLLSYANERDDLTGSTCGGVWSAETGAYLWRTCDHEVQEISPSGQYVVGAPSYYDGLGYKEISILDAATGEVTGVYTTQADGFIWSGDGAVGWTTEDDLVFATYDSGQWRLISMAPDGTLTELAGPVAGEDFENPWLVISH